MQSYISSLSRFVPTGSAIWREYETGSTIGQAGLWKIQTGKKRSTGKAVSIFVFEKRYFETGVRRDLLSRADQDRVLDTLKKEVSQLTKLRHPSILEVVEPLEDTRSSLIFVTEPVLGCLEDIVRREKNTQSRQSSWQSGEDSSPNGNSNDDDEVFALDELEIQKGLLQLSKALQFCHQDAKLVHGNLTPSAVFVNVKSDWKLGGLGFSTFLSYQNGTLMPKSINFEFDYQLPLHCQPDLDYMAPELALENVCDISNDIFALGCCAVAVHGERGLKSHSTDEDDPRLLGNSILHCRNDIGAYRRQIQRLAQMGLEFLPPYLQPVVRLLLARDPKQRMTLDAFQNSQYFDNVLMSTIKYLETLCEKTRDNKILFMEGLLRILPQYPERVLKRKILAGLLEELKDHSLLPYTLPNVFYVVDKLDRRAFMERVFPSLKEILTVRDPPQNLMVLLDQLEMLKDKTPEKTFRDDVMPLVHCALESGHSQVVDKALQTIPRLSEVLDYTLVKSTLFPKIQTVYAKATVLSVKINALKCFHAMLKILDKFTMIEKLIPMLKRTKTREPGVLLAILIVYEEMGTKYLEKETIATEIMGEVWRICMEPQLSSVQFQRFMGVIKQLGDQVETLQLKHLQDVAKLNNSATATAPIDGSSSSDLISPVMGIVSPAVSGSGPSTTTAGFDQLMRNADTRDSSRRLNGLDADHPFKNLMTTPSAATPSVGVSGDPSMIWSGSTDSQPWSTKPVTSILSSPALLNSPTTNSTGVLTPTNGGSTSGDADTWGNDDWFPTKTSSLVPKSLTSTSGHRISQTTSINSTIPSLKSQYTQYKQARPDTAGTTVNTGLAGLSLSPTGLPPRPPASNPRGSNTSALSSFALPKPPRTSNSLDQGSKTSGLRSPTLNNLSTARPGGILSPNSSTVSATTTIPTTFTSANIWQPTSTSSSTGLGLSLTPTTTSVTPTSSLMPALVPPPSSSNDAGMGLIGNSARNSVATAKAQQENLKLFDPLSM
ncbi:Protein kinase domain-containing protein ppk32 [Dispira simplex]|nr:Protein kinase domain-containing protein ppk32 [Dispira simplex]